MGLHHLLAGEMGAGGRRARPRDGPRSGAGRAHLRRGPADRYRRWLDDEATPGPGGSRGSGGLRARASRKCGKRRGRRAGGGPANLGEATPRPGSAPRSAAAAGGAGRNGGGGGTNKQPHRDPRSASQGTVGRKQEGASCERSGRCPHPGRTGRLCPHHRRRGSPDDHAPIGVLGAKQRGRTDLLRCVSAHYLKKLLAALERDAASAASPAAGLPEPLSERELEVLRLIASGKSNRRIATEIFVSVGTVKTHINHLYRKLDAHSRTQALARARELKLL